MARLSRATRETIKTILVILAVLVIVLVYLVYPLNRTKAFMGRPEIDGQPADTLLLPNDLTSFAAAGLPADSMRIEADGLTKLAAAYIPSTDSVARGLAILIPSEQQDRTHLLDLAKAFRDSGFAIATYDQRATGSSSGEYHSDGQLEMADLEAVIAHLEIHGQIAHPLIVVGYNAGGDAALLTSIEEKRIDALAAIEPYLTTDRMIDALREKKSLIWFPLYRTMFWWWYNIRSNSAAAYREIGDLKAPSAPAILVVRTGQENDPAILALRSSAREPLEIKTGSVADSDLVVALLTLSRK